jgi:alpha-galactosidase
MARGFGGAIRRGHISGAVAITAAMTSGLWLVGRMLRGGVAEAAQTNIAISMTAPPATPRILGPRIFSGKPATPFLYTIAATGQAPLTFAARGLPNGLTLTAATGTISGTMPPAGSYPITVTVTNAAGVATGTQTLESGDTLSRTPPMGWNSFDSFGSTVTEAEVIAAAQAQRAQLQPFGWNYVVVDYLWFDPEQVIDDNGRYLPSPMRFPSAAGGQGLKPLADRIHALGLNFGLHIMRGISRKTYTANSPILGTSLTATAAGNTADTCPWDAHMWGVRGDTVAGQAWYDSIFAQYAEWGVDFLKVDDMIKNNAQPFVYHQAEVQAIRQAIDKTGRSMVLSLSPGAMQPADIVHLNANANMWRIVDDFWDINGSSTLPDVFTAAATWQALTGLNVGHWPDADMLPLGFLGPRSQKRPSPGSATAFSHNEQVTIMSLWSILPSPLMYGGNVPALTTDAATGPWTLALLTNEEVLAVNQDTTEARAKLVLQQGTTQVWARDLSGGRKAVALINRGTQDAPVSATFAQLGLSGSPTVRDLWHRMDVTGMTTGLSVVVPYNGALLYTLTPINGGAGGAGGAASGIGGGMGPGTGGNGSGSIGAAGGSAVGGSSATTGSGGATAATGSGGRLGASGGTGAVSVGSGTGGGAPGAGPAGARSGCGCVVSGSDAGLPSPLAYLPLGLAATSLTVRRRRKRRT